MYVVHEYSPTYLYVYYSCLEADLPICLEGLYALDTESFGPFTSLLTRFPDSQRRYYRRAHTLLLHFGQTDDCEFSNFMEFNEKYFMRISTYVRTN